MKRFIAILLLTSLLGGCATVGFVTAPHSNPFTTNSVVAIEAAYGSALVGVDRYVDLCHNRQIPSSCRTVTVRLQDAIRRVRPALNAALEAQRVGDSIRFIDAIRIAKDAVGVMASLAAGAK